MAEKQRKTVIQDKLFFDFPRVIPKNVAGYPFKSLEASKRRRKRNDEYGIGARGKGFLKATKNLWIPYSAGENSTVVNVPEPKIVRDKYIIKKRLEEKYEDSELSPTTIKNWAHFCAIGTEKALRIKFRNYQIDALQQMFYLSQALDVENRSYSKESIMENDLAINGLKWYLVMLKSFSGKTDDGSSLAVRKWVQPRWTKVVDKEMNLANNYLDSLNNEELFLIYEESFYNNWCRQIYWGEVNTEHKKYLRKTNNIEPDYVEVPIEVYENDLFGQEF
jgi:hypothetical protein